MIRFLATLERVTTPQVVAALAVLVGLVTWIRRRHPEWSSNTFAWPMAGSLLRAPDVYPWHMLWLQPFIKIGLSSTDHDMDIEHIPCLLCLAPESSRTAVVGSWLDLWYWNTDRLQ